MFHIFNGYSYSVVILRLQDNFQIFLFTKIDNIYSSINYFIIPMNQMKLYGVDIASDDDDDYQPSLHDEE